MAWKNEDCEKSSQSQTLGVEADIQAPVSPSAAERGAGSSDEAADHTAGMPGSATAGVASRPKGRIALRIFQTFFPKVFVGNIVLVGCVCIMLAATPGQSFFLGLYTDHFIEDFGMSRLLFSTIFSITFLSSTVSLQFMGRLVDRIGASKMILYAIFPYLCGMAITTTANGPVPVAIGFVITRILGPDGLEFAAKVTINRWYRRCRGRAMAIGSGAVGCEIQ